MLLIGIFRFCVVEEGSKRPLSCVTRAPSLGILIFCFHNLHKKGEKGVRKEGKPTVAMVDKNGVKILDDGVIVKFCPKILC